MSSTSQRKTIPITDYKIGDWVSIRKHQADYRRDIKGLITFIRSDYVVVKWTFNYINSTGATWDFEEKYFLDFCELDIVSKILRVFEL